MPASFTCAAATAGAGAEGTESAGTPAVADSEAPAVPDSAAAAVADLKAPADIAETAGSSMPALAAFAAVDACLAGLACCGDELL